MTTYNTGNPIGSPDPRDLYDNAQVIDDYANSAGDTTSDRLGVTRRTLAGMENEFQGDQDRRDTTFGASQADRAQRFNALLAASGYVFLADYAAGIEVTEYNEVIRDTSGEFWRVSGSTALPYTTTGAGLPEGGAFVSVGDAALRQDLAALWVETFSEIADISISGQFRSIETAGFATPGDGGGALYTRNLTFNEFTDSGFNAESAWVVGGRWEVSDGTATASPGAGSTSQVLQQIALEEGREYTVEYTISRYVAGGVRFRTLTPTTAVDTLTTQSGVGTFTESFIAGPDITRAGLVVSSEDDDYDVSNISIKKTVPDLEHIGGNLFSDGALDNENAWAISSSWVINTNENKATATDAGSGAHFREISLGHLWLIEGQEYEVRYTVEDYSAGLVSWRAFSEDPLSAVQSGESRGGNGTYVERFVAGPNIQTVGFTSREAGSSLSVRDISIRPVIALDRAVTMSLDGSYWVHANKEIWVEQLGATKTADTLSTDAFAQALALQAQSNRPIRMGMGTFYSGPLHSVGRVTMYGSGISSATQGPGIGPDLDTGTNVVFVSDRVGDYWLTWNGPAATYDRFRDFKVLGSGPDTGDNQGAFRLPASGVQSNRSSHFQDMAVENFSGYALWLPYTIGFVWQGGFLRRCGERGVSGGGMHFLIAAPLTGASLAGVSAQINPQDIITCNHGVYVAEGENLTIVTMSDVIAQFNTYGVYAPTSNRWRIENCYTEFNQESAMELGWGWEIANRKHDDGAGGGDINWNSDDHIFTLAEEGITHATVRNGAIKLLRPGDSKSAAGPSIYTGSNSPEGSEFATQGSLYLRRSTQGVPKAYIKRTGSSANTGWSQIALSHSNTTGGRPSALTSDDAGYHFFDTTLGRPVWWNGSGWVDAMGDSA